LPKLPATVRFGMVVMDADLFSSSLTVFENLFGRGLLSEGAIILFNSWNGARANPNWLSARLGEGGGAIRRCLFGDRPLRMVRS
jgi:hypothetical protein